MVTLAQRDIFAREDFSQSMHLSKYAPVLVTHKVHTRSWNKQNRNFLWYTLRGCMINADWYCVLFVNNNTLSFENLFCFLNFSCHESKFLIIKSMLVHYY